MRYLGARTRFLAEVTDDLMTVASRDRIAMSLAQCLRRASYWAGR